MKNVDYLTDLGDPGNPPYTRGIYPEMYRVQPWMTLQISGFETAEATRRRMELLFREGYRGYDRFGIVPFSVQPDVPIIVGVNKYQEEKEEFPLELGHKYETDEELIVERVKKFKREQDHRRVSEALKKVRDAALDDRGNTTPTLVEAAKTGATLGEMCAVLKEVFEWRIW